MRALVSGLLGLARSDQAGLSSARERLDWSKTVLDACLPFEPVFFERGLTFSYDVEPGLFVLGDAAQLSRCVDILLDNAQKYTEPGGDVHLALSRCGKARCRLCVSSTGEPLSPPTAGKFSSALPGWTAQGTGTEATASVCPSPKALSRATAEKSGQRARTTKTAFSSIFPSARSRFILHKTAAAGAKNASAAALFFSFNCSAAQEAPGNRLRYPGRPPQNRRCTTGPPHRAARPQSPAAAGASPPHRLQICGAYRKDCSGPYASCAFFPRSAFSTAFQSVSRSGVLWRGVGRQQDFRTDHAAFAGVVAVLAVILTVQLFPSAVGGSSHGGLPRAALDLRHMKMKERDTQSPPAWSADGFREQAFARLASAKDPFGKSVKRGFAQTLSSAVRRSRWLRHG